MDQWTPTRLGSIRVKSHLKLSRNSGVQTDRILCSLFAPPFLNRWHLPEKGHTFTGAVGFLIVLWGSGNMWWSIYKSQIAADTEVTGTYLKNCEVLFCDRSLCWAILRFIQSHGTEWAPETTGIVQTGWKRRLAMVSSRSVKNLPAWEGLMKHLSALIRFIAIFQAYPEAIDHWDILVRYYGLVRSIDKVYTGIDSTIWNVYFSPLVWMNHLTEKPFISWKKNLGWVKIIHTLFLKPSTFW